MRRGYIFSAAMLLVFFLFGCGDSRKLPALPTNTNIPATSFVGIPDPTTTATPSKASFPSGWTTYTNGNEMISGLAFDKEGHLWAASRGGLVMWDTANGTYRKYTTADGLPGNRMDAVFVDKSNTLWIGASGGIFNFVGGRWVMHKNPERGGLVEQIFQDSRGKLWFVGNFVGNNATTFDGKTWKTYTVKDGLGSNAVASIVEDRRGYIWLGTWYSTCGCEGSPKYVEGVSRFDGHKWDVLGAGIGLDDNDPMSGIRVNAMAVDDKGGIWFGTSGFGAKYYTGAETKTFTVADGLPDNTITDIQIDENNTVWIATNNGVAAYDGATWKTFFTKDGLVDNSVLSITIAPDHSIWFGTENGISRFDGNQWETYRTNDGLPLTHVNMITSTSDGAVWLATDKGAAFFGGHSWDILTQSDGLPGDAVSVISIAPDGSLWFGTPPTWYPGGSGAIAHLDHGKWTVTKSLGCIPNEGVAGIFFDLSGGAWVRGCRSYYYDGSKWNEYMGGEGTVDLKGAFSQKSGYWTGGWGGVSRFYNQGWIDYGPEWKNNVGWDTRALAVAPNGDIWVATEVSDETFHTETGFKRFDGQNWNLVTTLGLSDVTDMDFATNGTLWVATRDGAYKYDGTNWTHYTIKDGLAGNEITDIHVAGDGAIWFATLDGLTRFGK